LDINGTSFGLAHRFGSGNAQDEQIIRLWQLPFQELPLMLLPNSPSDRCFGYSLENMISNQQGVKDYSNSRYNPEKAS